MKLLLVDDSVDIWILLKDLLADVPGLEIAGEAGDVSEAVELARTLQPDVVILDIHLTGGSGIEVLHKIKQMQPAPIVVMLTGLRTVEYRTACANAGADYFFEKTTDLAPLYRTMNELARRFHPGN